MLLQAGCGATYGVVPFVSRRSTGIVCGLVSAGGASGGVINQALFFLNTPAKGAYGECLASIHCSVLGNPSVAHNEWDGDAIRALSLYHPIPRHDGTPNVLQAQSYSCYCPPP